jgi:hypothetical protein
MEPNLTPLNYAKERMATITFGSIAEKKHFESAAALIRTFLQKKRNPNAHLGTRLNSGEIARVVEKHHATLLEMFGLASLEVTADFRAIPKLKSDVAPPRQTRRRRAPLAERRLDTWPA